MIELVSVIVPCRNEYAYIEEFCRDVFSQKCEGFEIEIIIADGLSDDGTVNLIKSLISDDPRLRYINNSGLIVSTGLNAALFQSKGEIVVRMDVHTKYKSDYIFECVKILNNNPGIKCVGGAWIAEGKTGIQAAIAAAFQSSIGSGGASSRQINYSGYVDTVYLGAWRRNELLEIGGFDEMLVRNQDDELALRINRSGGRIWQSSEIQSKYYPRASLLALHRQFSQYGYWKIPVIKKHRLPASFRHVLPFIFLVLIFILVFLSPFYKLAFLFLASLIVIYISMVFIGTHRQRAALHNWQMGVVTVLAVAIMHFSYAIGFGLGILDFIMLKSNGQKSMSKLTR